MYDYSPNFLGVAYFLIISVKICVENTGCLKSKYTL